MGLIQDIKPKRRQVPTQRLIQELHKRGVTITDIFAQYYEMEAMGDYQEDRAFGSDERGQHGKPLTVGDAELAGLAKLPFEPKERQPF